MTTTLSPALSSVVDLARDNPGHEGSLRAVLALLEQASDSDIIVTALSQFSDPDIYEEDLRAEVADALDSADAADLAENWRPICTVRSNVVPLVRNAGERRFVPAGNTIGFDDIGGLETVKKQIRRRIIDPFRNAGLFQKFKRKAGGGVLMYGPPGCGKTMMARALAKECGAEFVAVHPADIIDCHWGETEKKLTALFAEVRASTPAVVFFDEVEALAQRRNYSAHNNFLSTMVSTLLTEMDGFEGNNEGLLFLGATNVPWAIDSAFRRPGRFDRTIFVPPPDRVARKFILTQLLADRPVANRLDVDSIVQRSSGFSGADLAGLIEAAVDLAIDDSVSERDLSPLSDVHFDEAFEEVRASTGEWLAQARNFAEFANGERLYDDLAKFLKKHAR